MDGRLPPAPTMVVTLRADFASAASYLGATATGIAETGPGRVHGVRVGAVVRTWGTAAGSPTTPRATRTRTPIPARDPQDHAGG
jgi:hypothetical protein